jgi:hypothetical protein
MLDAAISFLEGWERKFTYEVTLIFEYLLFFIFIYGVNF